MQWLALPLPWRDEPGAPAPAAAGWWALQFTPRVAVVEGDVLLLELSTTERLWGGRAAQRALVLQAWTVAAVEEALAASPGDAATSAGAAEAGASSAPNAAGAPHPRAHSRVAQAGHAAGLPRNGPQDSALKVSALSRGISRAEEGAHRAGGGAGQAPTSPLPPWGSGTTSLAAQAMLRMRQAGLTPPARMRDLPLHTLSGLRPWLATLERMGCRTWGALRALPRAGVARRLGAAALQVLDQAVGDAPEAHIWLELPEQFTWAAELPALAESASALLWSAQRALHALQGWLQARHQGALALELSWRHDLRRIDGVAIAPTGALQVRTAEPTQDMAHLRRLLAEHLARTRLAAPANHATLRLLESAPLAQRSASLLLPGGGAGSEAEGEPLHQLLERLSARLGVDQVQAPELVADHRPECMQRWMPAAEVMGAPTAPAAAPGKDRNAPKAVAGAAPHAPVGALLPTWLVQPPRPLAVQGDRPCHQGPLRLLAGPHRFEAGWWNNAEAGEAPPAQRDYFMAHNAAAGLVWVFREWPMAASEGGGAGGAAGGAAPQVPRWFLHGIFG